jgi:hypothetical protein
MFLMDVGAVCFRVYFEMYSDPIHIDKLDGYFYVFSFLQWK